VDGKLFAEMSKYNSDMDFDIFGDNSALKEIFNNFIERTENKNDELCSKELTQTIKDYKELYTFSRTHNEKEMLKVLERRINIEAYDKYSKKEQNQGNDSNQQLLDSSRIRCAFLSKISGIENPDRLKEKFIKHV